MKRTPKKKAKPAEERIHLESFGDLMEIRFTDRGFARALYDSSEVIHMLSAMQRYILRRQKIPSPKLLDAIDALRQYFTVHGSSIRVTGDLFIAFDGVRLEPIIPGEGDEPAVDESASGKKGLTHR